LFISAGVVDDVNAAIEEDVDVVAVSIMTSGHLHVAENLCRSSRKKASPT
jgi:methylmalonyl-CoA mutase cobalamin-binding subunit